MKRVNCVAIFYFFFWFVLVVDLSLGILELGDCPLDFINSTTIILDSCGIVFRRADGGCSKIGCRVRICQPNKQQGYVEADNSKYFPNCCKRPICAE